MTDGVSSLSAWSGRRRLWSALLAGILLASAAHHAARAETPEDKTREEPPQPGAPATQVSLPGGPTSATAETATGQSGLLERGTLLGDLGGLRTLLGRYGISIGLSESAEVFGNATGGTRRGVAY